MRMRSPPIVATQRRSFLLEYPLMFLRGLDEQIAIVFKRFQHAGNVAILNIEEPFQKKKERAEKSSRKEWKHGDG